jgi:hypothetical protein
MAVDGAARPEDGARPEPGRDRGAGGQRAGEPALLSLDPVVFFTEPRYSGYPAVLVRIAAIELDMLEKVLTDAWLTRASKQLAATLDR